MQVFGAQNSKFESAQFELNFKIWNSDPAILAGSLILPNLVKLPSAIVMEAVCHIMFWCGASHSHAAVNFDIRCRVQRSKLRPLQGSCLLCMIDCLCLRSCCAACTLSGLFLLCHFVHDVWAVDLLVGQCCLSLEMSTTRHHAWCSRILWVWLGFQDQAQICA